jgi:hypothetical protein
MTTVTTIGFGPIGRSMVPDLRAAGRMVLCLEIGPDVDIAEFVRGGR